MKRKVGTKTKNKSTTEAKKTKTMEVIDLTSPSPNNDKNNNNDNDNDGSTPLRAVFCLKVKGDMKEAEEKEDCFILDFDNPVDDHNFFVNTDLGGDDLTVVSEKGQVACRDYPHPRHLCVKNQFDQTSHDTHCQLCYCYVCDKAAPCSVWSTHCHAVENEAWKSLRDATRKGKI